MNCKQYGVSSTQSSRTLWSRGLHLGPQHSRTPGRLCQQVNEIRSTEIGRICRMESRCGLARAGEGFPEFGLPRSHASPPAPPSPPGRLQMVPEPKGLLTGWGSQLRWELGGLGGPRLEPRSVRVRTLCLQEPRGREAGLGLRQERQGGRRRWSAEFGDRLPTRYLGQEGSSAC